MEMDNKISLSCQPTQNDNSFKKKIEDDEEKMVMDGWLEEREE